MKKTLLLIIAFILALLMSCSDAAANDPLSYQTLPFIAEGSLSANGSKYVFTLSMSEDGSADIEFSLPETLRGYTFKVKDGSATLSYGDMTIDFNGGGEKTNIVMLIPSLFSLNKENRVSCENNIEQNSVMLTKASYNSEDGDTTVYINESTGYPMRFEKGGITVDITKFSKTDPAPKTQTPATSKNTATPEITGAPETDALPNTAAAPTATASTPGA